MKSNEKMNHAAMQPSHIRQKAEHISWPATPEWWSTWKDTTTTECASRWKWRPASRWSGRGSLRDSEASTSRDDRHRRHPMTGRHHPWRPSGSMEPWSSPSSPGMAASGNARSPNHHRSPACRTCRTFQITFSHYNRHSKKSAWPDPNHLTLIPVWLQVLFISISSKLNFNGCSEINLNPIPVLNISARLDQFLVNLTVTSSKLRSHLSNPDLTQILVLSISTRPDPNSSQREFQKHYKLSN